jgi:hypothetical protein
VAGRHDWDDEFGSFRDAAGETPARHVEGSESASSLSLDAWGTAAEHSTTHLMGGLLIGGQAAVDAAPSAGGGLLCLGQTADFGSWAVAPATAAPGSTDGPSTLAGNGSAMARANGAAQPPRAAAVASDGSSAPPGGSAALSPLQSATSKALLLQQAHLQEFLAATKAQSPGGS